MPGEGQGHCALAEHRGQRAKVQLRRLRSALTREVKAFVGKKLGKAKTDGGVGKRSTAVSGFETPVYPNRPHLMPTCENYAQARLIFFFVAAQSRR